MTPTNLEDLDVTECEVRKLGYSADPWRIVHTPTGKEVWWETAIIETQLESGVQPVPNAKPGYRLKREAVDALDRLAVHVDELRVAS